MANRLTYTIGIKGDNTQIMAQIQQVYKALQSLGMRSNLNSEMQQASLSALQLANNLQKAMNVQTGKFDILAFQEQLNKSGMTIDKYYQSLMKFGDAGKRTFMDMAQTIALAEQPLIRTNTLVNSLWISMKNTVRWQITTGILNTLMGSINTAFGYAKGLDKSLNSIRIVTGRSADEMKRFAKEANEAARALNTTTTDYANASLIYFQQGVLLQPRAKF